MVMAGNSDRDINQFRIGVLGPKSCGKSSIVARLHRLESEQYITFADARKSVDTEDCGDDNKLKKDSNQLNRVMCVPVHRDECLGIKIVTHDKYASFCCVHSVLRTYASSHGSAIEKDGRVLVGDLLVAIGQKSLLNKTPYEVVELLKGADYDIDNHLLITFLRPGHLIHSATAESDLSNKENCQNFKSNMDTSDSSRYSSRDSVDSTSHHASRCARSAEYVYADRPAVLLTTAYFCYSVTPTRPKKSLPLTSYHLLSSPACGASPCSDLRPRPSVVEVADLPGNDPQHRIIREWLPRLDAVVLVYSASSASSLVQLENTYVRLLTKVSAREAYELPIVVVCSVRDSSLEGGSSARQRQKSEMLIMEGRAMADVWGAPFFVTGRAETRCYSGAQVSVYSNTSNGVEYIFESAIQQSQLKPMLDLAHCVQANTSPAHNKGLISLFNCLPIIGSCMSYSQISDARPAGRKVQEIEFLNEQEVNDDPISISSFEGDDDDVEDYDDGRYCRDNVEGSLHHELHQEIAQGAQKMTLMKKCGHTHDIWKMGYSKQSHMSLLLSAEHSMRMSNSSGPMFVGSE